MQCTCIHFKDYCRHRICFLCLVFKSEYWDSFFLVFINSIWSFSSLIFGCNVCDSSPNYSFSLLFIFCIHHTTIHTISSVLEYRKREPQCHKINFTYRTYFFPEVLWTSKKYIYIALLSFLYFIYVIKEYDLLIFASFSDQLFHWY